MPIVYALVARGKCVLTECTVKGANGNFFNITRVLLGRIKSHNTKMSLVCDKHVFHYIVEDGVTYMCMAEENSKRRIPFAFLTEVKDRFQAAYSRDAIQKAIAFGMNQDFSKVLSGQLTYFNTNPDADNFGRIRGQIDEVKGIMVQNIERVLERGEKIDLLVDKTEALNASASKFKKSAKRVSSVMWWKNCKMKIIIAVLILAFIYFILALACKGPTLKGC